MRRNDDEQLPLKLFSPLIVGGESEKSREKESTGCVWMEPARKIEFLPRLFYKRDIGGNFSWGIWTRNVQQ